ncbi:MAG: SLBB domain-containing protein, partial [Alphaproteobacteria bacterium]|nr:SLBB domain-containing protein [Alphaproteobacteria bacterium]
MQRIQGQVGGPTMNPAAQLDATRERALSAEESGQNAGIGPSGPTIEEVELRRQRSRAELEQMYAPSALERDYRDRLGDPSLRLFGYDLLRSTSATSGPLTGQVADNYVLGVGDELVVTFRGATNDSRIARIDREGRLAVGVLPPIRAAGRSLGSVRAELGDTARRTLLGTDVFVSVGSVRSITVFVGGEVERPGQFQMTSLSDIGTALARAGGIRRTGSLRQVRVVRAGGGTAVVDLYGLLGIGAPPAIRLQDGDRIVVPVVGQTAAISGAVVRPGIYELRGGASLRALIDYAGGSLRARGYRISVSRISASGAETFVRVGGEGDRVVAGDAVQIIGGSAGGTVNRVTLRGYVQNPGPRPLGSAINVRDLVGSLEDLRAGTYTPMAVLVRRDPATTSRVFEPVNLLAALRDGEAPPLRSDDQLYVFSQADIEFINRPAVRRIVLGGTNPLPQCRSLERLRSIVQDSQSPRFSAAIRSAFTQRRGNSAEEQGTQAVGGALTQNSGPVAIGGGFGARGGNSTQVAGIGRQVDTTASSRDQLVAENAGRMAAPAPVAPPPSGPEQCAPVFEELPDLLPFLIDNSAVIGGS